MSQQDNQQQPQHQQGTKSTVMPTAPYPPMISTRRVPAGLRSSISSSPQYPHAINSNTKSGVPTGAVGGGTTGGSAVPSGRSDEVPAPSSRSISTSASASASTSASASAAAQTAKGASNASASRNLWSRIRFCSSNLVACINCADSDTSITSSSSADRVGAGGSGDPYHVSLPSGSSSNIAARTSVGSGPGQQKTPLKSNRRLGPILLELRRLELVTEQQPDKFRLFSTRTIVVSRGNPSLGTSVSSTCLDVASYHHSSNHPVITDTFNPPTPCATGLTTGALCIHTFQKQDYDENGYTFSGSIEYFHTPRHHRQATAVSWRPQNSSHVALGLVGSSSNASAGGIAIGGAPGHVVAPGTNIRAANTTLVGAGAAGLRTTGHSGGGVDREFCCFLWDVEHQASKRSTGPAGVSPLFKLSHNQGVASLAWVLNGQTLAVGGQFRNIQLYDLRVSGTGSATPPISAFAYNSGVHGIQSDPHRPHQFATFCRAMGEPVKIWDARRMDSVVSEIKINTTTSDSSSGRQQQQQQPAGTSTRTPPASSNQGASSWVTSIEWSNLEAGTLSVAIGDTVQDYDTLSSVSRPVLLRVNRARSKGPILDMALYPGSKHPQSTTPMGDIGYGDHLASSSPYPSTMLGGTTTITAADEEAAQEISQNILISELYTHRMLVVSADRAIHDMAKHTIAPVAISRRDGRVVNALGRTLWIGSTLQGPSAMENVNVCSHEDISATMMRRARCLQACRYSTNTASNIKMLAEEVSTFSSNKDSLLRLWSWIDRIETLIYTSNGSDNSNDVTGDAEGSTWPCKGLSDAGIWHLLQMDGDDMNDENSTFSESLSCLTFESSARSAALTSCGWAGNFDLSDVLSECEALGEYERSAALAVWHGDIGAAVDALQRGADAIQVHLSETVGIGRDPSSQLTAPQEYKYAEALQLVSMCIAGYGGFQSKSPAFNVWRRACTNLMQREEFAADSSISSRSAYVRALCKFLVNIGIESGHDAVLSDTCLSLCDRVAFACRFLQRSDLKTYLIKSIDLCQQNGFIEGIVITGIEKEGVKILQSFVDNTADVQTAALVSSRVIFPSNWGNERKICAEWLDSYRGLLNKWQMWQSRAMFDVDRADLLRRIKARQQSDAANVASSSGKGVNYHQSRRLPYGTSGRRPGVRQPDPDIAPSVPAQLDARCTYCSSPLGLKRLDSQANQWLSKMKPVLSCCPQCRKPLPRCAICLLSMGCLNPYMELTRERSRTHSHGRGAGAPDDLSSLANLPFAEWFTWCMRCKHGGHAHHLVGWFANHDVCPVSGCDCQCQFDGMQKLTRPALMAK